MLHLVHLLCQLLTLLNGSFTKTFSSNLSTLAVVGCSLRANIQWDLFRCSRHRTSHHLYISIMSSRIIKTNQKLFFRPSIVETSRHSFGNEFLRYALKQKKTILFGNFSQTSDPPHPPLLGTPYPKKNFSVYFAF